MTDNTASIPTGPQPVWTPYAPENVVGEFGWLWLDGPMGHEWVLVHTADDEDDDDALIVDLLGRMDRRSMRDALSADDCRGLPYLSLSQPTVEPGKCDALEVAIRFAPGTSATHAFGRSGRLEAVRDATFAAMGLGRERDA